MPDGLTHLVAGCIGTERWFKGYRMTLFLTGSLLPDIFLRGGRLFFVGQLDRDFKELYLVPLHTPLTCMILCGVMALCFDAQIRKSAFTLLFSGCLAHFLLDLMQKTIQGFGMTLEPLDGYRWLYPISWFDFQIGVFWAEDTPYALIVLCPIGICLWLINRRKAKKTVLKKPFRFIHDVFPDEPGKALKG